MQPRAQRRHAEVLDHPRSSDDRGRRVALRERRELGYDALGVVEGHPKRHDFFVGGRYSVADMALYDYTHVAGEGGFDLDRFAAVRAWSGVGSQPRHVPTTPG